MLDYEDLTSEEKKLLREKLGVARVGSYYFEDNGMLLFDRQEMFEYLFLDDLKKIKDARYLIQAMGDLEVKQEDVGKTVKQIKIEKSVNVIKITDNVYIYKNL